MWEQSTEPTIVGGPVGHPDGSFNQIWGGAGGGGANVAQKSPADGWGGVNLTPTQPWAGGEQHGSGGKSGGGGGGWGDQNLPSNNGGGNMVNGWQGGRSQAPTTPSGWGGTAGPSPTSGSYSNSNSSQWTGTSPNSGGSSWSQVASKNVPQSMPAPQPAVRPKGASGYDSGPTGWGAQPIDQGTPWQEPGSGGGGMKNNDWNGGGSANWERGSSHKSDGNNWSNKERGGDPYWKSNDRHASSSSQWNAGGNRDGHWDGNTNSGGRSSSFNADQQTTPSNVWTGPPAPQDGMDSSMIWNNPYPKKTAQPDKGTNVWGDPTIQTSAEIKRWKLSSDENSSTITVSAASSSSTATQPLTPSSSSVWNDSPMAPQPQKQGWTSSSPTNNQNSSLTSPSWDGSNVKSTGAPPTSTNWGASDNGWNPPSSKSNEINRQSSGNISAGDLETDTSTDDVFASNPTSPLTPVGPLKNGTSNGLPANYPNVAQQLQLPVKSMQNNQQLQILTKQISVQLIAAVKAGLIDINILYHPLPSDSLLRLNELLGCVPLLEQAQRELQHLQGLQRQGQSLNPTQSQDMKRLTEDVQRYRIRIQQIKQQIDQHTNAQGRQGSNSNNGSSGDGLSKSGNDSLSQSKLMQWKNGANSEGNDKKLSVSSSAPNLENLEQNIASLGLGAAAVANQSDPWSNKRHSGSDWPTNDSKNSQGNQQTNPNNSSNDSNSLDGIDCGLNGLDSDGNNQSLGISPASITDDNRQDFPQEFKPGQPWKWCDPSKVAEDPNATPGSVKPSALTKINVDSAFSNSPFMHNVAYGGMQSFFGATTPTKMNYDKPANISPSLSADSYLAAQRHSRPPSQMGQPFNRPPLMKQPFSAPNAFVPYNNNLVQWVVLTNLTQIDERTLSLIINQYGTTTSVVIPPGSGFAFIKFREGPYERFLPRMQSELAPFGVSVQIMKENEVERLLQALSNRPQFNPNSAAPHAPSHHPPAGGLWDAPPPPPMGAWPPTAGGHPFGPGGMTMPDATMAQQLMPPMHDMFGGVPGNDRHGF